MLKNHKLLKTVNWKLLGVIPISTNIWTDFSEVCFDLGAGLRKSWAEIAWTSVEGVAVAGDPVSSLPDPPFLYEDIFSHFQPSPLLPIARISQHWQQWQWRTFSSPCTFLYRERAFLGHFDKLWLLCLALNDVLFNRGVVYQNWKIWGVLLPIIALITACFEG